MLHRLQRILLVRPDHSRRAALDPARGVVTDLVSRVMGIEHPAALVEDQAALLVKRNALDRDPGVADGAQDQAALELFALATVLGSQGAALLDQLVAADDDLLDLA